MSRRLSHRTTPTSKTLSKITSSVRASRHLHIPDDEKLDVLIVHLTRIETGARPHGHPQFRRRPLKTRDEKDAALVAFVSPTEKQWRFSYVKMEYAAVEKESGKVGVETRLTPARRFSYIVGEGESCHTAQTRFLALLQDTENDPTLAQLEEAFSVEAVTKEFFNQYAELVRRDSGGAPETRRQRQDHRQRVQGKERQHRRLRQEAHGPDCVPLLPAKEGLARRGKGQDWGTGPHDFLRRLARGDYGKYDNFFNDVLEPLFYDTLATDRGHEAWCNRFKCRIPFLNGGLFEPLADYDWRKTDIILPNRLFTNTERIDEATSAQASSTCSTATTSPSTKPSRWKKKWPLTRKCSARSLKI